MKPAIPTLTLNSSWGSQEPIFNKGFKAGAAAEPNSRADASNGSNCKHIHMSRGQEIPQNFDMTEMYNKTNAKHYRGFGPNLLHNNGTRQLLCQIGKFAKESVFFHTVFQV